MEETNEGKQVKRDGALKDGASSSSSDVAKAVKVGGVNEEGGLAVSKAGRVS